MINPERLVLAKILNDQDFLGRIRMILPLCTFKEGQYRRLYELCLKIGSAGWVDLDLVVGAIGQGDGDGLSVSFAAEVAADGDPGDIVAAIERLRAKAPLQAGKALDLAFDQGLIRGCAEAFADLYGSRLESPWQFFAFAFLTMLGEVIADRVRIKSELRTQPRLYTVIIGDSAWARKSEAIQQTVDFFREMDLLADAKVCYGVGSAEGLGEQLKEAKKTILVFDELQTFVSKARIESSVLLQVVNGLFEKNSYNARTKDKQVSVEGASLSILAASTAETYKDMFTSHFIKIGFINRLWVVAGEPDKCFPIPEQIPWEKKDKLAKRVKSNLDMYPAGYQLNLTGEAEGKYRQWYEAVRAESKAADTAKRLDTYAMRLMMLACINEGMTEITGELVGRVIDIVNWEKRVRAVYDPIDAESAVAKVEGLIRKALMRGEMKERSLQQSIHYQRHGIWAYNQAKVNLVGAGEIGEDQERRVMFLLDAGQV